MSTVRWIALVMVLACAASPAARAEGSESDCRDRYRVVYTVKPAGQQYWISPDHVPQTALPLKNEASAGKTMLTLNLSRRTQSHLIAEFTMQDSERVEALVASIAMDQSHPTTYGGSITNSESGSIWAISLTPMCASI